MLRFARSLCGMALLLGFGAGCMASKDPLMHVADRVDYAIQPNELKGLEYRISSKVLARNLAEGDAPDSVIIVPEGTIGAAVAVGKDWLRVSFSKGGSGVLFLTDTSRGDDGYWIATEVEGRGMVKLRDLKPKVLTVGGSSYRLIEGSDAFLIVNEKQLKKIIDSRQHLKGR